MPDDRPADHGTTVSGRVLRVDRGHCEVLADTASGAATVRAAWRATDLVDGIPCVGDLVTVAMDAAAGAKPLVVAITPRRTAITRVDPAPHSSAHQVLAANIDVVAVCEPCPRPTLARVERMLALAWESGARPAVIVTKVDLAEDLESVVDDLRPLAVGVPLLTVAITAHRGASEVAALVAPGETMALLGRSGAGKSTLLNALVGRPVMDTRQLRGDGKGRHTTTHRQMVALPGGAFVVDTPGVKGVGVPTDAGLEQVFAEIEALAAGCRFSDCGHSVEPGCAVLDAVASGSLPERRLASYRKLQREAAYQARRADARLAALERGRRRQIHRQLRRSADFRP